MTSVMFPVGAGDPTAPLTPSPRQAISALSSLRLQRPLMSTLTRPLQVDLYDHRVDRVIAVTCMRLLWRKVCRPYAPGAQ